MIILELERNEAQLLRRCLESEEKRSTESSFRRGNCDGLAEHLTAINKLREMIDCALKTAR